MTDKEYFNQYIKQYYDISSEEVNRRIMQGDIPFWKNCPDGKLKDRLMGFFEANADLSSYMEDLS